MDKNKVILITGASSDIGKEIAKYFASFGINIIMTYYHNLDKVKELALELKEKHSVLVDYYYLDLCDEKSIVDLLNYVIGKYNKIDYLVNNAAISLDNNISDKTKNEFMKVMETNVVGTFLMMKYFDNIIDGFIFNISSTDGIDTGNIYSIDYNASKAAINNMTKTFSLYSKNRIICLCPNWVDSKSTRSMNKEYLKSELKRIGQKELIKIDTIPKVIDNCIKNNISSGTIIRIEGDKDVRRID